MKNLTILLTMLLMAVPALAHNNHHRGDRALGLEMLQDLADIPSERLRDLSCRYDNSNRDLCRIERVRKRTAKRNIDIYNGRLQFVKRAILADINERDNRRYDLRCDGRRNSNRDLCRYERIVLNELHNVFLPEINQAIRHNQNHRDRARRDRIERERRQREKDRIERERRKRNRDRAERDRRRDRRDDNRPRRPRRPRRG